MDGVAFLVQTGHANEVPPNAYVALWPSRRTDTLTCRTPRIRRGEQMERGTSGTCAPSPACACWAESGVVLDAGPLFFRAGHRPSACVPPIGPRPRRQPPWKDDDQEHERGDPERGCISGAFPPCSTMMANYGAARWKRTQRASAPTLRRACRLSVQRAQHRGDVEVVLEA
jgi:hypothetical protein